MTEDIRAFQETVWEYYRQHGRDDLPWRQPEADGTFDPYKIMVSELMLQQTQVLRVWPKFESFIARFPALTDLATASLGDVLTEWSGLGYNRRAKFLWQAAGVVAAEYGGQLPRSHAELVALPGIGPNTAGAIRTYAFNEPVVFVETNIRTVFIHHFFADESEVSDKALIPYIEAAIPPHEARDWYWRLWITERTSSRQSVTHPGLVRHMQSSQRSKVRVVKFEVRFSGY